MGGGVRSKARLKPRESHKSAVELQLTVIFYEGLFYGALTQFIDWSFVNEMP